MPRPSYSRPVWMLCLLAALAFTPANVAAQDQTGTMQQLDDDEGFDDWGLLGLLGLAGLLGRKRNDRDRVDTRPRA